MSPSQKMFGLDVEAATWTTQSSPRVAYSEDILHVTHLQLSRGDLSSVPDEAVGSPIE